jgi:Short C-terminal domain
MFGHEWEPGMATVIARKVAKQNAWESKYDYIVDVQPKSGGPVFRTSLRSPTTAVGYKETDVGGTMPVWCDPRREKAKIDEKDPANRYDGRQKQESADFDAVMHGGAAPAGRDSSAVAAPVPPADLAGLPSDEELSAANAAFQAALETGRAAMAAHTAAKASGDEAEIARLRAEVGRTNDAVQAANALLQRLDGLRWGWTSGPQEAPATTSVADPLARLEALAGLRDRGVLTDEEFAVQKAKILSES